MNNKIKEILDVQIQEEFFSAYLYLALAARLESLNLTGAANWMHIQVKEENDHAMGFYRFLIERNEEPVLKVINQPDVSQLGDIGAIISAGLEHEKHITSLIHNIYETAKNEKDYALESFIKWYIDEQVEEENNATTILDKIKMIGKEGSALYLLDQELGTRVYTPSGPYAAKGKA